MEHVALPVSTISLQILRPPAAPVDRQACSSKRSSRARTEIPHVSTFNWKCCCWRALPLKMLPTGVCAQLPLFSFQSFHASVRVLTAQKATTAFYYLAEREREGESGGVALAGVTRYGWEGGE
ncbi:unnamed protein product [Mesocestoides corti]|uniref:Uncharacterized protein n=1 Tax=Mesocestoides corti TaxID=53468 RepID=A0A0R3UHR2_MESCO|nr:unnamed protein product [Mesocestoides corti]